MDQEDYRNEIANYLESHGYQIVNTESLNHLSFSPKKKFFSPIDLMIKDSAENESVLDMPPTYQILVDFIEQLPESRQLKPQLKPLLFAFFYRTVIELHHSKYTDEAIAFFKTYTQCNSEGKTPFHSYHDTDIKQLQQYLTASSFSQTKNLDKTAFATQLTKTAFDALLTFLIDNSYYRFILILSNYINVTIVPLDHFSTNIPGFIYKSTEQIEPLSSTLTTLLKYNPYDLAKKHLGDRCEFEIFDDDPSNRTTNPFPLPNILHDRVLAVACDISNMQPLSKSVLPSCAYFTFNDDNICYDINGSGTLIAASTERGYVKLFSTNVNTDIDDELHFSQIHNNRNHSQVPRTPVIKDQVTHYCSRTLIGPRTYSCRFSPESRFLLCGGNSIIKLWSCEAANISAQFEVPCGIIWSCDWSPLGYHFVTASDDNCGWLWAVDRSKPLRLFVHHQAPLTDITYHPNAATLATASYDRSIMLWDIRCQNGANPFTNMFADNVSVPMVARFTRNGRVVISGDDAGKLSVWDIGERKMVGVVKAHQGSIVDMSISAEGTILASTGEAGDVLLWDMGTLCMNASVSGAEPLRRFQPRKAKTRKISFSNRNLLHAIGSIRKESEEIDLYENQTERNDEEVNEEEAQQE